jgi:hypothetical protein
LKPLLDALHARGFKPETVIGDTGYDYGPGHEAVMLARLSQALARARAVPLAA